MFCAICHGTQCVSPPHQIQQKILGEMERFHHLYWHPPQPLQGKRPTYISHLVRTSLLSASNVKIKNLSQAVYHIGGPDLWLSGVRQPANGTYGKNQLLDPPPALQVPEQITGPYLRLTHTNHPTLPLHSVYSRGTPYQCAITNLATLDLLLLIQLGE